MLFKISFAKCYIDSNIKDKSRRDSDIHGGSCLINYHIHDKPAAL